MLYELNRIKQMRTELGLTQTELANISRVSQSLIAKIERGNIEPSYSIARRIFIVLEELGFIMMSISFLFLSPIFSMKSRLEKTIRWILVTPFVVNVFAFVFYSISFGLDRDYRFEVAAITINWVVTILVGILIGIFFKREMNNTK